MVGGGHGGGGGIIVIVIVVITAGAVVDVGRYSATKMKMATKNTTMTTIASTTNNYTYVQSDF